MAIFRCLAIAVVVFVILDFSMNWGYFKQYLWLVLVFLVAYFFISMLNTLIRFKSQYSYPKEDKTEPPSGETGS